jgi:hypothetical protein
MPGLWQHMWQAITFCLVVDNFGIKVTDIADFHHLNTSLKEYYEVVVDWMGLLLCGVKLTWDYKQCHVDCSMPGCINMALKSTSIPRQWHPKMHPMPWLLSNMAPNFPTVTCGVEMSPGHHRHPSLLCMSGQPHAPGSPQRHCSMTIQWHTGRGRCMLPTT